MGFFIDTVKDWRAWLTLALLAGYVLAGTVAYLNPPATAEDYERALGVIDQAVADGELPKGEE